jgi:hypothetical protein
MCVQTTQKAIREALRQLSEQGRGILTGMLKLNLSRCGLTSDVLEILLRPDATNPLKPHLPDITNLDLSSNQLTSLPSSICQMTSLRFMDLKKNPLSNLPDNLSQLTALTRLDLDTTPQTPGKSRHFQHLDERSLGILLQLKASHKHLTIYSYSSDKGVASLVHSLWASTVRSKTLPAKLNRAH